MSDVSLTFDIKPFQDAIDGMTSTLDEFSKTIGSKMEKNVSKPVETIKSKSGKAAKGMEERFGKVGKKLGDLTFTNLLAKIGVVSLAIGGIRKVLSRLPEVGRTFKIAGDIISRNLLWPLRKELMPMLRNILAWVRDNRAMFVRWGGVLVNIFKAIGATIKGFVNLLKTFFNSFISGIKRVMGTSTKSITDMINIAIFKLSALFQFLMISLEPVADLAGEVIANIVGFFKQFVDGVMIGLGDISEPLNDIWETFKGLLETLGLMGERTGALAKTFKILGVIVGGSLRIALNAVAQTIDTIAFGIEALIQSVRLLKAWISDDAEALKNIKDEMSKTTKEFGKRTVERGKTYVNTIANTYKESKKIITEEGKEIEEASPVTGKMVKEATTELGARVNQRNEVTINVNGAGEPGVVAERVVESQKDALKEMRTRAGY